ncbi:RNA polymerase sigma-70 factor (ECF subfamily) [Kitasatospora herbaricolor]|uniref:RNA polymerase sigma factor SigM n=1 Tax=Kitasatospora herbaricolor TaxID=68217 RepID=UPI00174CF908|nr:RNA polymerase sigma factor SigM [Kitasatospora herbaricolor]MDQ0309633.1 RNA polymerase sigma-70 factor (ECF subfamily) [Kitasatospora herbaricolor]
MADAEDSDAELLSRHVAGDPDAFGLLVRRHRDRLWAVALRTLGDREEAADAVQDALVSAFRSAHTFQGRSAVTTWLHRIVVNACLDRARRTATRRTGPLDDDPQRLDTLVGSSEAADHPVVRAEVRREVTAALDALPAEQRAALVLVDMQGYPVAEAAEVLGVPVGTVKSRCARGRARLLPLVRHLRENPAGGSDSGSGSGPDPSAPGPATRGAVSPGGAVSRETAPGSAPDGNPTGPRTVTGTSTGSDPILEGDATAR